MPLYWNISMALIAPRVIIPIATVEKHEDEGNHCSLPHVAYNCGERNSLKYVSIFSAAVFQYKFIYQTPFLLFMSGMSWRENKFCLSSWKLNFLVL